VRKAPPSPPESRDAALSNLNNCCMEDIVDALIYRQDASALGTSDTFTDR
jgi:hypothetical protein